MKTIQEYNKLATNLPNGFRMDQTFDQYMGPQCYYPSATKVSSDRKDFIRIYLTERGFDLSGQGGKKIVRPTSDMKKIAVKADALCN
jgi:hypothetical protein